MIANIIFLCIGILLGTTFGCVLGENSEKDKRISDLKKQIRENEDDCAKLPVD